jgi:hypothetical protein
MARGRLPFAAGGGAMASAKRIVDWDHQRFDWVRIEDDSGQSYTYAKKQPAQHDAIIEVRHDGKTFLLVPDPADGKSLLRQSTAGLPPTTIVQLPETHSGAPMTQVTWHRSGGLHEYERK